MRWLLVCVLAGMLPRCGGAYTKWFEGTPHELVHAVAHLASAIVQSLADNVKVGQVEKTVHLSEDEQLVACHNDSWRVCAVLDDYLRECAHMWGTRVRLLSGTIAACALSSSAHVEVEHDLAERSVKMLERAWKALDSLVQSGRVQAGGGYGYGFQLLCAPPSGSSTVLVTAGGGGGGGFDVDTCHPGGSSCAKPVRMAGGFGGGGGIQRGNYSGSCGGGGGCGFHTSRGTSSRVHCGTAKDAGHIHSWKDVAPLITQCATAGHLWISGGGGGGGGHSYVDHHHTNAAVGFGFGFGFQAPVCLKDSPCIRTAGDYQAHHPSPGASMQDSTPHHCRLWCSSPSNSSPEHFYQCFCHCMRKGAGTTSPWLMDCAHV